MQLSDELEELAKRLAHSTRAVPSPADSYRLLGDLRSTVDHLEQVTRQLANWHSGVTDGVEYAGVDAHGSGGEAISAAGALLAAASALTDASKAIGKAHESSSVIRWTADD